MSREAAGRTADTHSGLGLDCSSPGEVAVRPIAAAAAGAAAAAAANST